MEEREFFFQFILEHKKSTMAETIFVFSFTLLFLILFFCFYFLDIISQTSRFCPEHLFFVCSSSFFFFLLLLGASTRVCVFFFLLFFVLLDCRRALSLSLSFASDVFVCERACSRY